MFTDFTFKTDDELLATAIGVKPGLVQLNNVLQIMEAPSTIYGVGDKRLQQVKAIAELSKRILVSKSTKVVAINTPEDAYDYVEPRLKFERVEHFCALLLNTKNQIIKFETISTGSLSASIVHPRELFRAAIENSAAAVIMVHNHPSGDPSPSREDIAVTERMVKVGKVMDIPVLDHIIIGDNRFCSLKERGLII